MSVTQKIDLGATDLFATGACFAAFKWLREHAPVYWNATPDGIPAQGTRYVGEMRIVLFQTDVPPGRGWNPHAGRFEALWTQTLRQAEE